MRPLGASAAASLILALGLACGGLGESVSETFPAVAPASAPAPPASASVPATVPAPSPAAAPASAAAPKPESDTTGGYTANVYGVCRKYADCKCSAFDTIDACVSEFGDAKDTFPPEVWACVLSRDCEGLCDFNAGTCFELYALQYTKGSKKGAADCPAGTLPVEIYDLHGDYVRTDCRE
jgi:hypothetical protein